MLHGVASLSVNYDQLLSRIRSDMTLYRHDTQ